MRILIALTYYRPHISGLTIYVERLAGALAARGHRVTVLTSRYDRRLPPRETRDGVEVIRPYVVARISKGAIMPTFALRAAQLALASDVLSLHLPQPDAALAAALGRLFARPVVLTYHSDVLLPPSPVNWLAGRVVNVTNHISARLAQRIVAYTDDFARHSPLLSRYHDKVRVIPPPVALPPAAPTEVSAFRARLGINSDSPVIGLAVRLAAEKGVEYLLEALPLIMEKYPGVRVIHAGPREPIGEAAYARRIGPLVEKYGDRYTYVGALSPQEMSVFFRNCDVHVLPSVNSTETFGIVQVEAALCGAPSVASALPGVRVPTQMMGIGLAVPPRDARALAEAVCEVLAHRERYVRPREEIEAQFSPASVAAEYEKLFASV